MAGFHIENFGCRAARADGEALSGNLLTSGQPCARQLSDADVVVVNTCSVTAEADRQARAFIRRAHRANPAARIVVTGCYAQRAPGEMAAIDGVSAVIGNSHKALAPQIIADLLAPGTAGRAPASPELLPVHALRAGGAPIWADDRFAHSFIEDAPLAPGAQIHAQAHAQTRPNLKVQEGCGNRCTFCVIPFTRGPSRSLSRAAVLRQVEGFVVAGGNELVLSGINLGRWGRDLDEREERNPTLADARKTRIAEGGAPALESEGGAPAFGGGAHRFESRTLAGLVRQILEQTALPRLRLSSIEPMDWDGELLSLFAEFGGGRLARHAHLPLQSGSDAVLCRMHRRYRPWHYREKVEALLCAAGPELTLGADVMAGFPGETDAEFEETLAFVRSLPFGYLHLFPFSPRPGTALHAAAPVDPVVVKERMAALRALAAEKTRTHRARFSGRTLEAITLQTPPALSGRGHSSALTENFLPVEITGAHPANRLVQVAISGFTPEGALLGCVAA
jgi:threonylcarbamoyladenosine tRNA methylthiotransferase MtaB